MMNHQKYHYVTALHGNEVLPTLALASKNICQIVGNPQAVSLGKRFIDHDLNASFGKQYQGHESKQAKRILNKIPSHATIIDFHTFSCISPPFAIITDKEMLPLAQQTGIKRIVYMKHNIKKGHALINHRPGVSIEVGSHYDPRSFTRTIRIVNRLQNSPGRKQAHFQLFEVYGIIKSVGKYTNFQLYQNKFYPILAGENAYNHCGLMARRAII